MIKQSFLMCLYLFRHQIIVSDIIYANVAFVVQINRFKQFVYFSIIHNLTCFKFDYVLLTILFK